MNFVKYLRTLFIQDTSGFLFSTSSVEVAGSNQGITALINVIIRLYNPLVKVFHNNVKD